MKQILCVVLCVLILLLLFTVSISAHSGRTDSSGGHYDHSSGEYHYHHGESAHQHPNGKCPYDSSGGILGLDYGTFFMCLATFTFVFSFLLFKFDIGVMLAPADKEDGWLPTVINIGIAIVLAIIALLIIRTIIV